MTLFDKLQAYSNTALPMHMPGHKRNTRLAQYLKGLAAQLDITEIDDFDDLQAPEGILADSMKAASRLWGSDACFYLTGGSTVGLLAAVYALSRGGGRAVIARNCHKSVFHALEITGLDAVFVSPEFDADLGVYASLSPKSVEEALETAPDARFVLVTSPTYEGAISDISGICCAAHKRNVPVIVDEAHGAHLGLFGVFADGAIRAGADVVVHSLHKTLPSLTQSAALHVCGDRADISEIRRAINMFSTSSPSYLLMASLDGCVNLLNDCGVSVLGDWHEALDGFYSRALGLERLNASRLSGSMYFASDPSKIVIRCANGSELMKALRRDFSIELEMAYSGFALAMTGAGDTPETLKTLADALETLDMRMDAPKCLSPAKAPDINPAKMSVRNAVFGACESVPFNMSAGAVCAEYAYAYPPGVPLIIPGETVTDAFIQQWTALAASGARMLKSHSPEGLLRVLK